MKKLFGLSMLFFIGMFFRSGAKDEKQNSLEVYGFAMTDLGYETKQINPNWFDALQAHGRDSKLRQYL